MILVLLWLSSAALVAIGVALRLGVALGRVASRIGVAGPLLVCGAGIGLVGLDPGGFIDGSEPLRLIPSLAAWAFAAAGVLALGPRAFPAAVALLGLGQLLTIRFLAGPAETLVFDGALGRAAWLLDKATLLEGLVREGFTAVWSDALTFPSHAILVHLAGLLIWAIPGSLGLLILASAVLLRAAAPGVVPRARNLSEYLGIAALALMLPSVLGGGRWGLLGLLLEDAGRALWLAHLWGSFRILRSFADGHDGSGIPFGPLRRWARLASPSLLLVGLLAMPEVVGLLLGASGAVLASLGVTCAPTVREFSSRPSADARPAHGLLATRSLVALAAIFIGLNQVDFRAESPQARPLTSHPGGLAGNASTATGAQQVCQARGATLCGLGDWRVAARQQGSTRQGFRPGIWEWVAIPSGTANIGGLTVLALDGADAAVLGVAAVFRSELEVVTAGVRCCTPGVPLTP